MTDVDAIKARADELGLLIAESEQFKTFSEFHKNLAEDKDARDLLDKHMEIFKKIHSLEAEGKPVEVNDKHELQDAQEALHGNTLLQDYARSQADFQELMNAVTDAIHTNIHVEPIGSDIPEKSEED